MDRRLALLLLVLAPACRRSPEAVPPERDHTPLSIEELPTTDSEIATANLDAQISGLERSLARMPDFDGIVPLVGLHLFRAELRGRPSDLERANELGERAVNVAPGRARAYLTRARARAGLHRFDDALGDLDEAALLAPKEGLVSQVESARASIDAARGHPRRALERLEHLAGPRDDVFSVGLRASALGELGELDRAEQLFARAQHLLRDTSPFPIAWLYLQEGLMWQRAGDLGRAKTLFAAAEARVKDYAPVAAHYAAVLEAAHDPAAAEVKLRRFVGADDPEYAGQLAGLLASSAEPADVAESARLAADASARYEALMARHPEAYAGHAARYFLGPGRDAARALAAAAVEVEVRGTPDAYELALRAALAADDWAAACRWVGRADAAAAEEPEIAVSIGPLAALARERCGR